MKKIIAALLSLLLLCATLFSCDPKAPKITDRTWKLASVTVENDRGGETLLCVSEKYVSLFGEGAELPRIDYRLRARGGKLTLWNASGEEKFTGKYDKGEEFSPDTRAYEVSLGDKSGYAIVTRAFDADGKDFPTLSISIGEYDLLFFK